MNNANLIPRVSSAIEQMCSALRAQAPFLSCEVLRWIRQISPNADPAAAFAHMRMFPLLQLPEWLAGTLNAPPDPEFQQSLIASSVSGYYYIRLIDDVMDRDRDHQLELSILPAAGFFPASSRFSITRIFHPNTLSGGSSMNYGSHPARVRLTTPACAW